MPDPSIRNWRSSPPQGGWDILYTPPESPTTRPIYAPGHGPQIVIDRIVDWRVNNNLPANEAQVFSFCNAEWCRRDPGRCLQPPPPPEPAAGAARRTLTPTDYGKACWTFLNTFGVHFSAFLFAAAVEQIRKLLDPQNEHNNGSGCLSCHGHFGEHLAAYPLTKVQSAEEAAVWTWMAHDTANVWAGKPHRPSFRTCAAMFGWPVLSDEQFQAIQTRLRATP
jgi:hypothetical protein